MVGVALIAMTACNNNHRTDVPNDNAFDNTTDARATDANHSMTNSDNTQMEPTGNQTQMGTTAGTWTVQDRDEMYRHLNMTQDQRDRFEQATRNNTSTEEAQMQRDRDARLREILNDDQYRKYETWRDDRMNRSRTNSQVE